MPAPPRRRGSGGVGLAEGVRCGGRVASVVDRGRGHRSAEVVLWVPAAPRRCRGSPPPRRLAIARNLSLTAALKFVVKPAPSSKAGWSAAESVWLRYLPPTPPSLQRAVALTALRVTARRSAVPAAAKAPRAPSARTRIFCAPLSTAADQATPWAKKESAPQRRRARVAQ